MHALRLYCLTCRYSSLGESSARPATPGTRAVLRPKRTLTLLPWLPRRNLAAWSPSQPTVERPSMLSTCTRIPGCEYARC